jgi:hypothetical protein
MARAVLATLARSGGPGPLNDDNRVNDFGTLTGESGRAAAYTKVLAGLAPWLAPERAGDGARILVDRIARTLPPPLPRRPEPGTPGYAAASHDNRYSSAKLQWSNLTTVYHEGLEALAQRAGEQVLVDLLKSPDCVERRFDLVRGALAQRLGRDFADPWEMTDWLRQHRADLDLDTAPRRPNLEEQR